MLVNEPEKSGQFPPHVKQRDIICPPSGTRLTLTSGRVCVMGCPSLCHVDAGGACKRIFGPNGRILVGYSNRHTAFRRLANHSYKDSSASTDTFCCSWNNRVSPNSRSKSRNSTATGAVPFPLVLSWTGAIPFTGRAGCCAKATAVEDRISSESETQIPHWSFLSSGDCRRMLQFLLRKVGTLDASYT